MKLTLLILFLAVPAFGEAPKESPSLRIRRIDIESKNVFDPSVPGEDMWLFRLANKVHLVTKPSVVEREIMVQPGSTWNPLLAKESEINLRSYTFIKSAEIEPAPVPGTSQLDLHVRTQDTWTLSPWLGFGTSGGKYTYDIGILERNLLGYGKTASFFHSKTEDRISDEIRYSDPRFLGSRVKGKSIYSDTNDGQEWGAVIERPFFSLSTLCSFTFSFGKVVADRRLFSSGNEVDRFNQDHRFFEAGAGFKTDSALDKAHRLRLSYRYRENRFGTVPGKTSGPVPSGRKLSGPFLSYQFVKANFLEETNIDKMERVEDFDLGPDIQIGVGYAPEALGSDRDRVPFSGHLRIGKRLSPGFFSIAQLGLIGRVEGGNLRNTIYFANANLYKKLNLFLPQTWILHLEAARGRDLDRENQIQLGGGNGLRGFKLRKFSGDKSILANLEARLFYPRELFHLLFLGGAVFLDAGRAWPEGQSPSLNSLAMDIGLGLRMGPSRSSTGMVARMDFAYAFRSPTGPKGWVVSIEGTLPFQPSNNSINHILSGPARNIREESEELKILTK